MINIKNIFKVLLVALFVCAYSGDVFAQDGAKSSKSETAKTQQAAADVAKSSGNTSNSADFCSSDQGIFTDLVSTGVKIFKQLRDLIYVVAGFGIIAVAVGGFFGNLNWKWLGAIIISLVVIATAGELVVLLTGCETFGSSLITNTLTNPTPMTTKEYNDNFTEDAGDVNNKWIDNWSDVLKPASSGSSNDGLDVPEDGI